MSHLTPYELIYASNRTSPFDAMKLFMKEYWPSPFEQLSKRPDPKRTILLNPCVIQFAERFGLTSWVNTTLNL